MRKDARVKQYPVMFHACHLIVLRYGALSLVSSLSQGSPREKDVTILHWIFCLYYLHHSRNALYYVRAGSRVYRIVSQVLGFIVAAVFASTCVFLTVQKAGLLHAETACRKTTSRDGEKILYETRPDRSPLSLASYSPFLRDKTILVDLAALLQMLSRMTL